MAAYNNEKRKAEQMLLMGPGQSVNYHQSSQASG